MNKTKFQKIIFLFCFWVIAALFFVFLEGTVIISNPVLENLHLAVYDFKLNFTIALIDSIAGAAIISCLEVLWLSKVFCNRPFGITLLTKTLFYMVSIFFFTSFAVLYERSVLLKISLFDEMIFTYWIEYIISLRLLLVLIYWGISVFLALFILQINDKFGKGVLWNLLLGKYHIPKEDCRIFMFLDLTSSTSIAEKLDAKKYSSFLTDFFADIDQTIDSKGGSVFQYVGDEVVIIWECSEGINSSNCIDFFFAASEKIKSLESVYLNKYGIIPEFKAGLHFGKIIITEVGGTKQEIAYHGDTINTASRICASCTDYNKKLIISADLLSILENLDDKYLVESLGVLSLKGKKNMIGLFSINSK